MKRVVTLGILLAVGIVGTSFWTGGMALWSWSGAHDPAEPLILPDFGPLDRFRWIGSPPLEREDLQGRPVFLFLWTFG